jgi:hypothetical protein
VSVKWAFPCQASRILHNPLDQAGRLLGILGVFAS